MAAEIKALVAQCAGLKRMAAELMAEAAKVDDRIASLTDALRRERESDRKRIKCVRRLTVAPLAVETNRHPPLSDTLPPSGST